MRVPPEKSGVLGIERYAESSEPNHLGTSLETGPGYGVLNSRPLSDETNIYPFASGRNGSGWVVHISAPTATVAD